MLTLWNLFEATLLCLNAVCVLHEERFMQKSCNKTENLIHFLLECDQNKDIRDRGATKKSENRSLHRPVPLLLARAEAPTTN
ncbi:hypothetical protein MSG28_012518 [Choristoneura fumiferana]|uniref:Uncharacterized protein n=1 Tax=Choristoneura fumiferana TaxID=7141 RepID=A0ACC0KDS4_CHOFU|nr:hypothetical protein MSG28_012518 [Choristoneura fumiferana]